jgi:nucleotide-binding universal stress UspA family protein
MQVRRIMCPVDFSESSTAALDQAASLAVQLEAQLLIVHVDEHQSHNGAASSLSEEAHARRQLLERMAPSIKGVEFEHHLVSGKPADEIPNFARRHHVDLVVMGRRPIANRFHCRHDGVCVSTSQRCQCPVMTINHDGVEAVWIH